MWKATTATAFWLTLPGLEHRKPIGTTSIQEDALESKVSDAVPYSPPPPIWNSGSCGTSNSMEQACDSSRARACPPTGLGVPVSCRYREIRVFANTCSHVFSERTSSAPMETLKNEDGGDPASHVGFLDPKRVIDCIQK
jgi:hypothetical protein